MNEQRKAEQPDLVCTCNDLYIEDIQEALRLGEESYKEIFAIHDMAPRCCGCIDHVQALVAEYKAGCAVQVFPVKK